MNSTSSKVVPWSERLDTYKASASCKLRSIDATNHVVSTRFFLGNFKDNKNLYEQVNRLTKHELAKKMFGNVYKYL